MSGTKYLKLAVLSISLGIVGSQAAVEAKSKTVKTVTVQTTISSDDQTIRATLTNFGKLIGAGDAAGLSNLWTADGEYVDEDGVSTHGRQSIERRFNQVFTQEGKPQLQLAVDKIKFLAPTVASVEGTVQRDFEGQTRPGSQFSLVMVKDSGNWLISQASERPVAVTSHYDYLRQFDWIIGDWNSQGEAASVHMKAEWLPNKNFILCKYETKKANGTVAVDIQLIGWDPILGQPRSWHFDSAGGYGHGMWSRVENQWICDSSGVESDGSTTRSKNIISINGADAFTWSSVNRSVNGMAVGDAPSLQVQRIR